jgi:CRISPR system Cascade subunit CasA
MNLTTEAWIPAVWRDGRPATVTLREAFQRGDELQDLAVRPHERVALMRLLICVAQAALDGPADHDEWKSCKPRIAPAVVDYLKRWHHTFELLGSGQRFLQATNLKKPTNGSRADDEGNSTSKTRSRIGNGEQHHAVRQRGRLGAGLLPRRSRLDAADFPVFLPRGDDWRRAME